MKKFVSIFALSLLVFSSCNDTNYLYDVKEKYVILDPFLGFNTPLFRI